ncbi:MAG: hypothetical protein ABDH28_03675 [Brevinematia bacterium]
MVIEETITVDTFVTVVNFVSKIDNSRLIIPSDDPITTRVRLLRSTKMNPSVDTRIIATSSIFV